MFEKETVEEFLKKNFEIARTPFKECQEPELLLIGKSIDLLEEIALNAIEIARREHPNFTECLACGKKQPIHCIDCGLDAIAKGKKEAEQLGYEKAKQEYMKSEHLELLINEADKKGKHSEEWKTFAQEIELLKKRVYEKAMKETLEKIEHGKMLFALANNVDEIEKKTAEKIFEEIEEIDGMSDEENAEIFNAIKKRWAKKE